MKTKKGATLVGSLVAITILSITLVAALDLQASIIRSKFFLQYDNTANLLVAQGLEIVRAIDKNGSVPIGNYTYFVETNSTTLPPTSNSTCTDSNLNNTCDLGSTGVFYRFVTINNLNPTTDPPKVTSTVVVKNPKGGSERVYKATIKLYKIN